MASVWLKHDGSVEVEGEVTPEEIAAAEAGLDPRHRSSGDGRPRQRQAGRRRGSRSRRQIIQWALRWTALGLHLHVHDHFGRPPLAVDVSEADRDAELAFLKTEIDRGEIELLVRRIDAYDRFSDRC